jgi:DNA-binding transcriptional LysR family regulator
MPWDERTAKRLKLRDLNIFKTVTRFGSMGRAAAQLAISPPAISKAITDLEHVLGVRLLDRSRQGVEPTQYGSALLKWSTAVFDDLKQGVEEIDTLADPSRGIVRVGTSEQAPAELVSAVITLLSPRYPRLAFSVIQAATAPLQFRDLRERSVDLIFGRLPLDPIEDEDFNTEILFEDQYIVISGEGSKWLRRRHIELDQLVDEPWCLNVGRLEANVISAFRAKGLEGPRQIVTTNSNQLKHALVATGQFLSVTSASRLRLSNKRLGLRPLKADIAIPPSQVGLVTLKGRMISPAAQLFIDGARKITRPFANKDQ